MSLYYIVALYFGAYFLGSIPFGKLVAYSYGIDIQKRGSGNIGFAIVRRIVGWRAGLVTLVSEVIQGLIPTPLALNLVHSKNACFVCFTAIAVTVVPI